MAGKHAYIVGGANSAGQAALHLADYARRVTLVVRAQSLRAGMSHYLARELEAAPNVEVRLESEVIGGGGDGRLRYLELRRNATGDHETVAVDGLFVLIGARPRTDWLPEQIERDRQGFLLTGADVADDWRLERPPLPARNEHARGVRIGRCAAWIRQAGGLRGGGGVDRDPARPQSLRR